MNNLYSKIKGRTKDEIKSFVLESLVIQVMDDGIPTSIGFTDDSNVNFCHGFIPFKTRVFFDINSPKSYSLNNNSFYYDFAEYLSDFDINNEFDFINNVYSFIDNYFGKHIGVEDRRDEYFDTIAFQTSSSDQDYYEKLEQIELCDFKGKGIAMSSEKAIMAENLLSLFGIDTYCCFGVMSHGLSSSIYSFNVVTIDDNNYIVDFSSPCKVLINGKNSGLKPFIGSIDDLEGLLVNKCIFSYDDYDIIDKKETKNGNYRRYSVGTFVKKNKNSVNL